MGQVLFFANVKKDNQQANATGTVVGSKTCLDVYVANSISTVAASYAYIEHRFHLPASTNINASTGAWIQLETAADISDAIAEMRVNWNGGDAIQIGVGANAGAVSRIGVFGAGQTAPVGVSLVAGDKVWIKAVQNSAITAGELLVTFLG